MDTSTTTSHLFPSFRFILLNHKTPNDLSQNNLLFPASSRAIQSFVAVHSPLPQQSAMGETIPSPPPIPTPPITNYILGFLLIGLAWGFTTPFIRRAARLHTSPSHPILQSPSVQRSWFKSKVLGAVFGVVDLLRDWKYALPLVLNLTGSVWFFLLIGQAGIYTYDWNIDK
jgi:hypothetical protein